MRFLLKSNYFSCPTLFVGAAYTLPYYLANFAPWMPTGIMQRLTTGTGAGGRNVEPEQKVGVSKPMMGMMNDMADAVGGALVRISLCELSPPHVITRGDKSE